MEKSMEDDALAAELVVEGEILQDTLDYSEIVERGEADRLAGRVLSSEDMRIRTDAKLATLGPLRRSA